MSLIGRLNVVTRRCCMAMTAPCNGVHSRITRYASTSTEDNDRANGVDPIKKSVFISQSTDIFTNLALEDWFYRNYDFTNHHVLLVWRNDPCVVFGRHQNPWNECNVQTAEARGIALARRNSGGGTVYHDHGNLNLSFFTTRSRYHRRYNLDIITRALYREWGLKSTINKREDIVVDGDFKISGTASKLGRVSSYHHCTLLVDVNKKDLRSILQRKENGIVSNATASVRSPIKNLVDVNPHVQMNRLISAIGWEYLRTKPLAIEDGGYDFIQQQKGFQLINPTEDWFPGLEQLIGEFRSWRWNFGKTPRFTVTQMLEVPVHNGKVHHLNLSLEIQEGIVEEIRMTLPAALVSSNFDQDASVISNLRGTRYDHKVMENIMSAIGCKIVTLNTTQTLNESNMIATQ